MANRARSVRPAPVLIEATENNGGGHGFSHRLAQIADRYLQLLRRTPRADLTEAEVNAIRDALNGTILEPAEDIRGALWVDIEDACVDGLAEKWEIDGPALVARLKALDYAQEVRLVEEVERFWNRHARAE